ncbi:MAG: undecaprenyl-diphosphate phosphatase [Syntrophobacteria bacterium]
MNILQALGLGVLQGITEFLPVSSSGHLVLAQRLFGIQESQLFFDVAVHAGTLMALFLVFRLDLLRMFEGLRAFFSGPRPSPETRIAVKMAWMIVVGSIPAAAIGLSSRDVFEFLFRSPVIVGLGLWTTALILTWSRWSRQHRKHLETPGFVQALLIGVVQGGALIPGVSRSGTTIAVGLILGLRPDLAFRFSFLLSIPAILGALGLELLQGCRCYLGWHVVAAGFFSAFLVGWAALRLLLATVRRGKLFAFAPYCFIVGGLAFLFAR